MKVLDKIKGAIVEVAFVTNNGFVYHLINSAIVSDSKQEAK